MLVPDDSVSGGFTQKPSVFEVNGVSLEGGSVPIKPQELIHLIEKSRGTGFRM